MSHYADSSFLVSCYHLDANTHQARQTLARLPGLIYFTQHHALEVRNAFELGIFRGLVSRSEADTAWNDLRSDLRAGRLVKSKVLWRPVFALAARLSKQHTATLGTRSLDILHVATAQSLSATRFISFDTRQRALAAAVGLNVTP